MIRNFLLTAVLLCAVVVVGCNGTMSPTQPESQGPLQARTGVLPPGTTIDSVQLVLHVLKPGGLTVAIHPYQVPWDETTVTWNDCSPTLSPFVVATFSAADTGTIVANVTGMVALWMDSIWVNEGMVLDQSPPEVLPSGYGSRETGSKGPSLRFFCWTDGVPQVVEIGAEADAYVDQSNPTVNRGHDSLLFSGETDGGTGEYRTLIRFNLDEPPPSSLGDRVWEDLNENGVQDAGEPGLAGVMVNLLDCSGALLATTNTDANGLYRFDALQAGSYAVQFVAPPSYEFSPPAQGFDAFLDSDADPLAGRTGCIDLPSGMDVVNIDAGLFVPTVSDEPGCTHGKGYWTHRARRSDTDLVGDLLPVSLGTPGGAASVLVSTREDVLGILKSTGSNSNGIGRLYQHLLATRLNIAAGASSEAISSALSDADAFLAAYGLADWDGLGSDMRDQVEAWKDTFEQYNEGEIGPGSCEGDGSSQAVKRGDYDVSSGRD